ncbi:MAG: YqeG family HAD IIIA-type phosphatase [Butyricicoccus pullicaecorum]|nr:YqeG family HAD IIIA-type phosphatase [Butyricicoccus pullicaecorum]
MKHILTPCYVFDTVTDITPEFLQTHGIHGCLIDLDGTLVSRHQPTGNERITTWLDSLRRAGIRPMLLSNNNGNRVRIFAESIGIEWQGRALKPLSRGFRQGAERLNLPFSQIAVIGDQIYTDTLGGNHLGALTCYVETIDRKDFWIGARYYLLERIFIEHTRRRNNHEH